MEKLITEIDQIRPDRDRTMKVSGLVWMLCEDDREV